MSVTLHGHKIKDMLGAITGDTIGSRFEFGGIKSTDFELFGPGCRYTDDSVMTVAVAEWLMDDPSHSHEVLEEKMVKYGELDPNAGYGGMFSAWLFYPESKFKDGKRKPYNSFGNGSAMRASAVGWMFDTLEETESCLSWLGGCEQSHVAGQACQAG